MPRGVSIDPDPDPDDVTPAPGSPQRPDPDLLATFAQLRAEGSDAGGNTTVTLDGSGRLVDFAIERVVVDGGRRDVERGVVAAFAAAFEELQRQREEQARTAFESGGLAVAGITADLQRLGEEADARLRQVFERLEQNAARMTGSS